MQLKRAVISVLGLLVVLAWAGMAQAQGTYLLGSGSGGQLQIGNGLPLPIQVTMTDPIAVTRGWGGSATGPLMNTIPGAPLGSILSSASTVHGPGANVFPPLLIPPRTPGVTVMDTVGGGLVIPMHILSKPFTAIKTVGVNVQNSMLHAVATRLAYKWPATSVTLGFRKTTMNFTALPPTPPATVALPLNAFTVYKATTPGGGKIRYVNPGMTATGYFGGVARFNLTGFSATPTVARSPGAPVPSGPILSTSPVTVYAIAGTPPPCSFPCPSLLLRAAPAPTGAAGGTPYIPVFTAGGAVIQPNIEGIKAGTTPLGTIDLLYGRIASGPAASNMASSRGFPWTTGRITVTHPAAAGIERFILSGTDARVDNGAGTIQLVSGALSLRPASGPNSNRGWIQLNLVKQLQVPAFSSYSVMALSVALLAIAGFVAVRRRGRA